MLSPNNAHRGSRPHAAVVHRLHGNQIELAAILGGEPVLGTGGPERARPDAPACEDGPTAFCGRHPRGIVVVERARVHRDAIVIDPSVGVAPRPADEVGGALGTPGGRECRVERDLGRLVVRAHDAVASRAPRRQAGSRAGSRLRRKCLERAPRGSWTAPRPRALQALLRSRLPARDPACLRVLESRPHHGDGQPASRGRVRPCIPAHQGSRRRHAPRRLDGARRRRTDRSLSRRGEPAHARRRRSRVGGDHRTPSVRPRTQAHRAGRAPASGAEDGLATQDGREFDLIAVEAVDDRGARSTPAVRAFFADNIAPSVQITQPQPSALLTISMPPTFTVHWVGQDPDAPNGQPASYKYILLGPGSAVSVDVARAFPDSVRRYYAPNFDGWTTVPGTTTQATFFRTGHRPHLRLRHRRDRRAGRLHAVLSFYTNMFSLRVAPAAALGPRFAFYTSFFNFEGPGGAFPGPEIQMTIPAGRPSR